jgi:ankyrin repeat protein
MFERLADGRTDLVFDYLAQGHAADSADEGGVSLVQWCAYHGDVSALRYLVSRGAPLAALGENLDLSGAVFHGHWRLCEFLIEHGADVNHPSPGTGETPLHAALSKTDSSVYNRVLKILLASGADPNSATRAGVETEAFMRDCRTKGETPLHRAAAFGDAEAIQLLLDAGAAIDARDAHGDTPLSWASWYLRPRAILRMLCYGRYSVRA